MHKKITQYLNDTHLSWVILDSIPKKRLIDLMTKLGIEYKGVRISSIPHDELSYGLANESLQHTEVIGVLIKILNEENSEVIREVSQMSKENARLLLADPDVLMLSRKMGAIIWALLSHPDDAVNSLVPELLRRAEDVMGKQGYFIKQSEEKLEKISSGLISKKTHKKLLKAISSLEEKISIQQKMSSDLLRENGYLRNKLLEQKRVNDELRKLNGEFAREKGIWHKEIQKKEMELDRLSQQVRELKNQLAVGPKIRLKSEIHKLEKENIKLSYILEKEQQHTTAMKSDLEKGRLQLQETIRELELSNSGMRQELEKEKQKFEDLQKEYRERTIAREPPLPKEKGRRLGIFIDNQNVYYSARMHFGKKLNFPKLLETLVKDRHLVKAICYIVKQSDVDQTGFITMLKNYGITVRERELIRRADGSAKGNWDIGIAVDVITMVEKNSLDIVTLVTCDGDFVDLVKLLSIKGTKTEVVGFSMNMAMDLKKTADEYYFITEDCMLM